MKTFAFIAFAITSFLLLAQPVSADTGYGAPCVSTYGNPCNVSENILVNKAVQNPANGDFVDNLGTNDPKFGPLQTVTFRITVTNTGNTTLSDVKVVDTLPNFVTFVSGAGNFDANTKKLTFHVLDLKAGEARQFTLVVKTVAANELSNSQGITCVTNTVIATKGDMESTDNTQFCIQTQATTKGGLPVFPAPKVTTTPATGAESTLLFGLIPTVLTGFALRKKAGK